MKRRIISIILILSLIALLLPGCVFVSREFCMTRDSILDEIGNFDTETEVQLQIGSGLLSLSRMIVSMVDHSETDMAVDYLRDIRNVQVGVYKLTDFNRDRPLIIPVRIARKLSKKGYEAMVKVKDRDSATWVMTKMRGKRLTSLYVISLDRDELVLVEVEGRLGRLIEKAVHDHGFDKNEFILNNS
ncbi:DUF4252 domain-containing protein [candidate division KSB1 bacterium]|nr:DUF4252 domain-containing protein [candidate division KSB1 bacterium]MBL7094413.1 DUF4252 domain-containing protein [candidate division KSB1 bacterium]